MCADSSKKSRKVRIDKLLLERGLAGSREKAQALIMAGKITVDSVLIDKAGKEVDSECEITVKEELPYVGRGGVKLEGALKDFSMDVSGLVLMDVGSSTGGFTDCLLKHGASRVHAIDVGKGLLDIALRGDKRVHLIEGKNIRYLKEDEVGEKVDLALIDVSFISLKKVIPKVKGFLKQEGRMLALIKPQFEVGKGEVGKGGIVRDTEKHQRVIEGLRAFSESEGFRVVGVKESRIKGTKGNKEFWLCLVAKKRALKRGVSLHV